MGPNKAFTGRQLKAIEALAAGVPTTQKVADIAGVHVCSILRWKQKKGFMEAVIKRSRALLKENLPEVYKALTNRSKKGSDRHIKIMLDHMENLEEIKSQEVSISFTWLPTTETNNE